MNALYHELFRIIDRYRAYPHVEIEARVGWKTNAFFDTNIQLEMFDVLKTKLKQSHSMTEVLENTNVYIVDRCRVITTEDGEVKDTHKKIKLHEIDLGLEGSPYDVRLSVCQERPVEKKNQRLSRSNLIRSRRRVRFIYKMFNYDLTEVFVHATNSKAFEFEIELNLHNISRQKHSTHYLAHSMSMKLEDIIKFTVDDCEKIHLKNIRYL
jgi:hypothetical protein